MKYPLGFTGLKVLNYVTRVPFLTCSLRHRDTQFFFTCNADVLCERREQGRPKAKALKHEVNKMSPAILQLSDNNES